MHIDTRQFPLVWPATGFPSRNPDENEHRHLKMTVFFEGESEHTVLA